MTIEAQAVKRVWITPPAAIVDDAAFTTTEVDTAGFDYAKIVVGIGATDIAMVACKVTESDTSGSGHADVSGLDTDGDTNIAGSASTLPTATDDNKFVEFEIDLLGRKRYLDLSMTAGDGTAGTFACAWVELSRAGTTPGNVLADRGDIAQILRV